MGSGFKTFTAGAVLTASDVNNYLMEQSVMVFATTAARDLAITSPEEGMVAFIGSNDANEGLYVYHGATGGWRKGPGWNAPWGVMGHTSKETATTGVTTLVDVSGLSVTFAAVANRLYRVDLQGHFASSGSASTCLMYLRNGSTTLQVSELYLAVPDTVISTSLHYVGTASAGSQTFKVSVAKASGGTLQFYADASFPQRIIVTDIGPSGAPA
jgi:hypothetical protein